MPNDSICEDGSFNIDAVITEFLADSSKGWIELPHMTTGQRKLVKKAVELQPELKCESYGFGQERRLHLFKKSWDKAEAAERSDAKEVMNSVNVKNTFIDDWVGGEGQSEPIIFRSMPEGVCRKLLQQESNDTSAAVPELSPIKEASSPQFPPVDGSLAAESPRPGVSAELHTAASPSTAVSNLELPPGLEGFQVRNTFIHIDAEVVDERMVQSMPHGMFSQAVEKETMSKSGVEEEAVVPEATPSVAPPWQAPSYLGGTPDQFPLVPGMHVVVEGLTKLPAFNGLSGVIQSLDVETGRFSVLLVSSTLPSGQQLAKVKGQNLRPFVMPPPPPQYPAPTVLVDVPSRDFFMPNTPEGINPLMVEAQA